MTARASFGILAAACLAVLAVTGSALAAEFDKFGLASVDASLSNSEAGAHPDFTTHLVMKTDPNTPLEHGEHEIYARLKDVIAQLPPGLIGNLNAVTPCSAVQFAAGVSDLAEGCPVSSQVGISESRSREGNPGVLLKSPIFELVPPEDGKTVARLGFLAVSVPVFIDVRLRSDTDYGLTAEVKNLSALLEITSTTTTLWGVPADPSHDTLRLTAAEELQGNQFSPPRSFGAAPAPFLSNPTSCGEPLAIGIAVDSYQEPGRFDRATAPLGTITGCEKISFEPSLTLLPTTSEAAAPTGLEAKLTIPQNEAVNGRSTAQLRDAVIRLPDGLSISPGAADGLAACSDAQVGFGVSPPPPASCPLASKIARVQVDSPSLSRPLEGAVYQRTPEPGHLFRAWLVADELGVHVKIPGEFQLDPQTGRVTSLFLDTPPVPLRHLTLSFKGGPRGVLSTPRKCGTYQTEFAFTPWSGSAAVEGTTPMTIDRGCDLPGFSPQLEAGSANPVAGSFSTLVTRLVQASGEPNLSGVSVSMPPGVLAKLKGVPLCADGAAASGACPAESLVGHTAVASGFGPAPLWIPQPGKRPTAIYLAGPYRSAPYSLVVDVPAEAGPFDLGDVVVRVALEVDSATAQVTAVSDSLPQLIEGVPVSYREVRIELDRPDFTLNPTSCDAMRVTGVARSVEGASAPLASRFQVAGCQSLAFKPKLELALKGATHRAGDPALSATLTMPPGGANIAWSRVTLPHSEAIDNAHINNPCTRVQFNADACPLKSVLGTARAFTPLLDQPLEGPVYFRSNGGERQLPDIVADLRGPIHVVLVGFIDSTRKGQIRNTFAAVPDAPITKFTLNLYGGKRGLIENTRNICRFPNRGLIQFNGQNGKIADFRPEVRVKGCGPARRVR